ncbi:hypothetical protein J4G48_0040660 [Bradyrhizobium barranii subsp. apii]|uniref:hypothetical protein n=1 Tax=Bradyrhizobium barranii TaxID=2992140 RepID=UPI001AA0DBC1|nr:hypothetical protein [Bradyrhizobium barranii]UPT95469.1 hypothetical protein J4G48_0040660 [Bradyrhizobium barranii subsp. apii]
MNGFVLYRGPSMIDGEPIICIALGLNTGGSNSKTGHMVQVYILRADMNPLTAVQNGSDKAICGSCPHRGRIITDPNTGMLKNIERSCYVTLMHGPRVVWDAYQRGLYPDIPLAKARKLLARRVVRLGSYGDPGAVPFRIWEQALDQVTELSGYTHLWRDFPTLSAFCMASCDSEADRVEAKALGFRTFRVRGKDDPKLAGEGHCPASKEMGKATQCAQCLLCGGARSEAKADITIIAHGTGAGHYERSKENTDA